MFQGAVGFCGSRSIGKGLLPLASQVVSEVLRSASIAVGCCVGADSIILNSVISQGQIGSCQVFAAFGLAGQGACSLSAVSLVSKFAGLGGSVCWWAGGRSVIPLRVRLAVRTRILVSSVAGLVAFISSPALSSGSWLAVRIAVSQGVPVVVFPVGFKGGLPHLGAGQWVPAGSGVWVLGFRWVPAVKQLSFF